MYAKDIRPPSRRPSITPPRNYSGTAFFESQQPPEAPSTPSPPENLPQLSAPDEQPPSYAAGQDGDVTPAQDASPASAKPHGTRGFLSALIPPSFSEGDDNGIEELLLVGLIFLLSREERDNDILLILALLLLYR